MRGHPLRQQCTCVRAGRESQEERDELAGWLRLNAMNEEDEDQPENDSDHERFHAATLPSAT